MEPDEHQWLYDNLTSYQAVDRLAKKKDLDRDLLFVIYTQRTIREATHKYYKMKHKLPQLRRQWKDGRTFLQIAKKENFPPVLIGLLILQSEGISPKRYRSYLNDLSKTNNKRLKKELAEINKKDPIYSPSGTKVQLERGKMAETAIANWLMERQIAYRTETDLRGEYPKTPDFLLDDPINVRGTDIHWIESKASFGDKREIRKNMSGQLEPYREMFDKGMVIYWYGFISGWPLTDGILKN